MLGAARGQLRCSMRVNLEAGSWASPVHPHECWMIYGDGSTGTCRFRQRRMIPCGASRATVTPPAVLVVRIPRLHEAVSERSEQQKLIFYLGSPRSKQKLMLYLIFLTSSRSLCCTLSL